MKIEYKEYIEKLVEELAENRKNKKLCFFKHYRSFELYENEIVSLIHRHQVDCKTVFYEFSGNRMQDAYCPFLNLIREMYQEYCGDMDVEKFLDVCNVYPVQKYMFAYYIKNGICKREEDIIPREVNYEHERFIQSVCNMLEYLMKENKLVLVINKLHLLQDSTLDLLEELIWHREIPNMVLICLYNESYNVNRYMQKKWHDFKIRLEDTDCVIKFDEEEAGIEDIAETFEPDMAEINSYMDKINDSMFTLAFQDANYYLEMIYHSVEIDKMGTSNKMRIRVLLMYALTSIYNGQSKRAYVLCKKVQDLDYLYQDIECQYLYNYVLAHTLLYSGQRSQALEVIENARSLARSMDDTMRVLQIDMLNIVVLLNGCQDTFVYDMSMEIPQAIMTAAEKYNQKNHLAYACLFGFVNIEVMKTSTYETKQCDQSEYFIKGIEIAREIDNIELQLLAWQKNAAVASSAGQLDEIIRYYGKCMEIMEGLDRPWDEIQINNGIGYSCIINERYELANDYFKKALNTSVKIGNSMMIVEAIYNMSVNAIDMGDYVSVVDYIKAVLKMTGILKIERIRTCNKSKLYGMLIFAYIKLHMIYDARLYFDKMKTILKPFLDDESVSTEGWKDDIFLYHIVEGMLYKANGQYKEAVDSYVQARFIWNKSRSKQEYIYARFVEEEAEVYKILMDEKKVEGYFGKRYFFLSEK